MPYITNFELGACKFQVEKTIAQQIHALLNNSYFVIGAPVDDVTPGYDVYLKLTVNDSTCIMHLPSATFVEVTRLETGTPKGHVVKPVKLSVEVRFF